MTYEKNLVFDTLLVLFLSFFNMMFFEVFKNEVLNYFKLSAKNVFKN